jgi:hypothetical protein
MAYEGTVIAFLQKDSFVKLKNKAINMLYDRGDNKDKTKTQYGRNNIYDKSNLTDFVMLFQKSCSVGNISPPSLPWFRNKVKLLDDTSYQASVMNIIVDFEKQEYLLLKYLYDGIKQFNWIKSNLENNGYEVNENNFKQLLRGMNEKLVTTGFRFSKKSNGIIIPESLTKFKKTVLKSLKKSSNKVKKLKIMTPKKNSSRKKSSKKSKKK